MSDGKGAGRDTFVNPYTFVSVPKGTPEEGWRAAPPGHGMLDPLAEGRCSGVLEVELTARSPLLLRHVYDDDDGVFPRRVVAGFEERVPYLPGSSLAGAVRSLHETLAGGCLRIFNGDFRPGYRDQVRSRPPAWRLARVDEVDEDGRPTRMQLCPQAPVWVESAALHRALGGAENLRTGARVTLLGRGEEALGRRQLEAPDLVREGGDWVVLVTDARTRRKDRRNPGGGARLRGRYFCATGELEDTVRAVEFGDGVWESFLDSVDDTNDMREFRQDPAQGDSQPLWKPVQHPKDSGLLGRRIAARRRLYAEQVVWVLPEVTGGALVVKDVALAVVWRHAGGVDKARQRVPAHALACTDPQYLCPSCRVFGSADTETEGGRGRAEQNAYRGHVRFGDAVPREAYEPRQEWLPPMSAPKPGAGQFYLNRDQGSEGRTSVGENARPLREWGSEGDGKGRRGLRGRKQYWLTGTPGDRPYFRAGAAKPRVFHEDLYEPDNRMLAQAESVPAGAVFTTRVHFENLTAADLGGLLCALDPALLLHPYDDENADGGRAEYGWAVGGGRPLGFGTVTSRVTVAALDDAVSRYLGETAPPLGVADAVAAFRRTASRELKDIWKRQLTKVLRLDWAPPHQVWYPPAGQLPEPDQPLHPQALLPSFTFWKETTGGASWTWTEKGGWKKGAEFSYRQLPASAAPSPEIEAIPQEKQGPGNKGEQR
ncbi:TIGR03986 family type III CRISPR-associated RAMP protein [Streptomyces yerevanensis]|uniref:TIGR03986 family type III CRISPR-associated RAMP protein n=1 Tax=Streptomyces yerevanensis TaxID=66378 RepID=UPI0005262A5D|nr:TIGR03986 family CRISPR-associated RAMP protein [Streptomyces yerevanensis]